MPDDVGGPPFADGDGPDSQNRGAADEAFAAVVLDEDFVQAAAIHEPTAAERILYAALERAESEATGDPPYFPEPDMDPGMGAGLGGAADGHPDHAYRFGELTGPDADLDPDHPDYPDYPDLAGYPGFPDYADDGDDGDDEEGRFDRSDYTRYLADEDDDEDLAYGGYAAYGGGASHPPRAPAGRFAAGRPGRSGAGFSHSAWRMVRWQRPVACVLAVVMGISVVALALIAIQRAGAAQRGDPSPGGPASPAGEPGQPAPMSVEAEIPDDDR